MIHLISDMEHAIGHGMLYQRKEQKQESTRRNKLSALVFRDLSFNHTAMFRAPPKEATDRQRFKPFGVASFFTAGWISSICHFPSQRVNRKARTDDEELELERMAAGEDSKRKKEGSMPRAKLQAACLISETLRH
ncbi:hypothetical protein BHM03_00027711 [Ensete ventricosum]|nr:hypothetical protein BHM03_00027711 [Ensete ventricosum]